MPLHLVIAETTEATAQIIQYDGKAGLRAERFSLGTECKCRAGHCLMEVCVSQKQPEEGRKQRNAWRQEKHPE